MVAANSKFASEQDMEQVTSIFEDPVKHCSVKLSDVMAQGKRLEASVFDVDAIKARYTLTHGKYPAVDLISDKGFARQAWYGKRLKRNYVDSNTNGAIGFLGSSEMLDCKPEPVKFMLENEETEELRVNEGLVLMSRSGTIGNVTYVGKTLSNYYVSEHAIRIACREFPGYLYAFLKSDIGKKVVTSSQYGAVIREIEPEHLAGIPVPNPPLEIKKRINDLILNSYELRDESNELLDQAEKMLIEELHLPNISEFDVNACSRNIDANKFTVKLSDMAGRLDASYHVPLVEMIVNHLRQYAGEMTVLGDNRISKNIILAGVFKRTYVDKENGYPFLGGKEVTQLVPQTEKYLSRKVHRDRYEKELKVSENMILVTDRGTIGTIALVPKHWDEFAVSQNVLKLVPASLDVAGYIYVFLNSDYGKCLIRRYTYGSVVDMIDDDCLSKVAFPLLKNQIVQKTINDLALKSNEQRYEAYKLEKEALRLMDEEVIFA